MGTLKSTNPNLKTLNLKPLKRDSYTLQEESEDEEETSEKALVEPYLNLGKTGLGFSLVQCADTGVFK